VELEVTSHSKAIHPGKVLRCALPPTGALTGAAVLALLPGTAPTEQSGDVGGGNGMLFGDSLTRELFRDVAYMLRTEPAPFLEGGAGEG
jgi:hypothetical protein